MTPDKPQAPAPLEPPDADLAESIAGAAAEAEADPAALARVKRRLLQRIAADNTPRHLTVHPGEAGWQPFGSGVAIKVLHESGGVMSYLLRLDPGAALPAHRHPVDEECVVLEGEVRIGSLVLGAGGFHLGRQGVLHDVLESPGGAVIFLRGAVPEIALAL